MGKCTGKAIVKGQGINSSYYYSFKDDARLFNAVIIWLSRELWGIGNIGHRQARRLALHSCSKSII